MDDKVIFCVEYSFYSQTPPTVSFAAFSDGREALDFCSYLKSLEKPPKYLVCDPLTPIAFIKRHLRKKRRLSVQLALEMDGIIPSGKIDS